MAGKLKTPASTLLETIVAILIISIVFSISLEIYNNVAVSSTWLRYEKLEKAAEEKIQLMSSSPYDALHKTGYETRYGYSIRYNAEILPEYINVALLTVEVKDQGGNLVLRKNSIVELNDKE